MPPQYVKAYVKTNKHDAADAEACCEAVQRPSMRFAAVKSADQQATLMLHRVRDQLIGQRTATINAVRGHLAEFGIVAAQRQAGLRQLIEVLGEVEDDRIPLLARELLQTLVAHLRDLADRIAGLDRRLVAITGSIRPAGRSPRFRRSPAIATAFAATVPDGKPSAPGAIPPPGWASSPPSTAPAASSACRDQQARRRLPAAPADPRRPGPGQGEPGPHGRTLVLGQRRAGRRPFNVVLAAWQEARPHPLGDAEPRRSLSPPERGEDKGLPRAAGRCSQ